MHLDVNHYYNSLELRILEATSVTSHFSDYPVKHLLYHQVGKYRTLHFHIYLLKKVIGYIRVSNTLVVQNY